MWTDLSSVLSQCTPLTDERDRQTDRRTEFSSLYRVCITCSAVKRWWSILENKDFHRGKQRWLLMCLSLFAVVCLCSFHLSCMF